MSAASYTIRIAKEDFKFSAAHFTIFPDGRSELLHGHNYSLGMRISGSQLNDDGFLLDIAMLKRYIREICSQFDEQTLVPEMSPLLQVRMIETEIEMLIGDKRYVLPVQDVVLLPIANITMELLAQYVWESIAPKVADDSIDVLEVEIEETAGQSCAYTKRIAQARDK